jgi:predicted transcriptional regulator
MRRVSDAMDAPPVVVDPATRVQDAAARMLDAHVDAAVVVDRRRVCGLVTAGHVAAALAEGHDATETQVGAIAARDPSVVRADDLLVDAHLRMRAEGCAVAPVVGSRGEPVGVLVDHEAGE